ncbi:hypothetical protein X975_02964, partial [Stegodyphus mimosarum]
MVLIKKHVAEGITVMTDEWRIYSFLGRMRHRTVNHSTNFVHLATGAHIQFKESNRRSK